MAPGPLQVIRAGLLRAAAEAAAHIAGAYAASGVTAGVIPYRGAYGITAAWGPGCSVTGSITAVRAALRERFPPSGPAPRP